MSACPHDSSHFDMDTEHWQCDACGDHTCGRGCPTARDRADDGGTA